jgi:hypothetical protein
MVIKSRRMRQAMHALCMKAVRNVCRIFPGNHEGKRPLGRLSHRWEYNTEINLKQVLGCAVNSYS